jgi:hypothetical protein
VNGEMLWFDREKDVGIVVRDDGERFDVKGDDFAPGSRPTGRCKGTQVTFEVAEHGGESTAVAVAVVPIVAPRRARPRRRMF